MDRRSKLEEQRNLTIAGPGWQWTHPWRQCFSRGKLYTMLANPVFICRIRQRNQVHPGQHGPIVDAALCDGVRQRRDKRASSD